MLRHIITLAAVAVLTIPSVTRAQSATIEFPCSFASSKLRITPTAIGYNGAPVPLSFNTAFTRVPKWEDNTLIVSTDPISVDACRSVSVTFAGATAVTCDDPRATIGLMKGSVQVVDAETGHVLQQTLSLCTYMRSVKPGHDTSETSHLTIDLSTMQAKNVILRFVGLGLLPLHTLPYATIDNAPRTEIQQVN